MIRVYVLFTLHLVLLSDREHIKLLKLAKYQSLLQLILALGLGKQEGNEPGTGYYDRGKCNCMRKCWCPHQVHIQSLKFLLFNFVRYTFFPHKPFTDILTS